MSSAPLFRPSSAPHVLACAHFSPRPGDTGATLRGTATHEAIAAAIGEYLDEALSVEHAVLHAPEAMRPAVAFALELVAREFAEIAGLESAVTLHDAHGRFVSRGTVDLWGVGRDGRLKLADWKTGQTYDFAADAAKDHSAQLKCYAHGLFSALPDGELDALEVFLDEGQVRRHTFARAEAAAFVDDLAWRRRHRAELSRAIHPHCDYCAERGDCPAWTAQADLALQRVPLPAGQPPLELAALKSDPERLGQFLVAYRRLKTLVEDEHQLERAAKELLAKGVAVPGFSLRRSKGRATLDAEAWLHKTALPLGFARTAACIGVSVEKARAAWADFFPGKDFPVPVEDGPPTLSLHLNPPDKPKALPDADA